MDRPKLVRPEPEFDGQYKDMVDAAEELLDVYADDRPAKCDRISAVEGRFSEAVLEWMYGPEVFAWMNERHE